MAARDPITCHVLDTTAGRPAASITATLRRAENPSVFTAVTNADGRIANWRAEDGASIADLIEGGPGIWRIRFDTGAYYGEGNTFFPEVEVAFWVKGGEHFHVPLLLSPYSYTTYRGS
jgi:5-hydroxyisourate hydrolase